MSTPDLASLKLNLSFVLHERSDSTAVARVAAACLRHAAQTARHRLPALPAIVDGELPDDIDLWLTATLGLPELLTTALSSVGALNVPTLRVDAVGSDTLWVTLAPPAANGTPSCGDLRGAARLTPHRPTREGQASPRGYPTLQAASFFRAPATLALPVGDLRVGVVALLLRPGGRATQLAVRGPFAWVDEEHVALRALERLIQAHVEQWTAPRALWDAPAERLLGDEIA